jgi:hypothetical protein
MLFLAQAEPISASRTGSRKNLAIGGSAESRAYLRAAVDLRSANATFETAIIQFRVEKRVLL